MGYAGGFESREFARGGVRRAAVPPTASGVRAARVAATRRDCVSRSNRARTVSNQKHVSGAPHRVCCRSACMPHRNSIHNRHRRYGHDKRAAGRPLSCGAAREHAVGEPMPTPNTTTDAENMSLPLLHVAGGTRSAVRRHCQQRACCSQACCSLMVEQGACVLPWPACSGLDSARTAEVQMLPPTCRRGSEALNAPQTTLHIDRRHNIEVWVSGVDVSRQNLALELSLERAAKQAIQFLSGCLPFNPLHIQSPRQSYKQFIKIFIYTHNPSKPPTHRALATRTRTRSPLSLPRRHTAAAARRSAETTTPNPTTYHQE